MLGRINEVHLASIVPLGELPSRTKMSLSKELIDRFRALYINKYGKELDFSEAESQLKQLAELVRLTSSMQGVK